MTLGVPIATCRHLASTGDAVQDEYVCLSVCLSHSVPRFLSILLTLSLCWVEYGRLTFVSHFKAVLSFLSLDECITPRTAHNYNDEQHKNFNNHSRELLTYVHKLNQMKLKPGLGPYYIIQPVNIRVRPILQLSGPARAPVTALRIKVIIITDM